MTDNNYPPSGGNQGPGPGPQRGNPHGPGQDNPYQRQQPNPYERPQQGGYERPQQPNPYERPQQSPYDRPQAGPYGQPGAPGQGQPQGQPGPYVQPGQHGQTGQYGPPGQYGQPPQGQAPYDGEQASYGQPHGQPPYGPFGHTQQFAPEPPKKRGKLVPLLAVLAMLMVIGAGGAFAYSRLSGGGAQPASVLPASAVGYVRIDLDPSAGQKVAAIRFMMKFPSVREKLNLTGDSDDLREKLFDLIKDEAGEDLADVDYARDVKPWLGDRAGAAVLPGPVKDDEAPDVVVAVQVKDKDKAKTGLDKLFAQEKDKPGVAFADSYAVIAKDQSLADKAVADAKADPLSENPAFDKDMAKLGEQGFASAWFDFQGIAGVSGQVSDEERAQVPSGSVAAALRFNAQYVELKAMVRSDGPMIEPGAAKAEEVVTSLPNTTAAALAISDGQKYVDNVWKQLQQSSGGGVDLKGEVQDFADQYGFALPDDLKTLLGENFVLAVDKEKPAEGLPKLAAKVKTDPAKAEALVRKLTDVITKETGVDPKLATAKNGDTLVVATGKEYADRVLKGGDLGGTDTFKIAVPDPKGSTMIGYVDMAGVRALMPPAEADDKDLAALRAVGFSSRVTGTGTGEFELRVVAN